MGAIAPAHAGLLLGAGKGGPPKDRLASEEDAGRTWAVLVMLDKGRLIGSPMRLRAMMPTCHKVQPVVKH